MHDITCFSVNSVGFMSFESYTGLKENPRATNWKAIFCDTLNFPLFFSENEVPKKEYFQKVSYFFESISMKIDLEIRMYFLYFNIEFLISY